MKIKTIVITLTIFTSCSEIKRFERGAEKGDLNSCFNYVEYYVDYGDYYSHDKKIQEKIVTCCKKGLALDTNADYQSFFYRELAKSPLINKKDKYTYYLKAAKAGDAPSQLITGLYYLEGRGGQVNTDSAIYWMKETSTGSELYAAIASKELVIFSVKGKLLHPTA